MCNEPLDSSRLYGVIGEAARLLPDTAFASLEVLLAVHDKCAPSGTLQQIRNAVPSAAGTATDAACAIGLQEREALGTILEILHSSQQGAGEGFGGELNDRLIEGLILAGRLIVEARVPVV